MTDFKHCDDYIEDETQPECLRAFLDHARAPAGSRIEPRPPLFARHNGARVRVVMASRFGDVGITTDLTAERGYDARCAVADLSDFKESADDRA